MFFELRALMLKDFCLYWPLSGRAVLFKHLVEHDAEVFTSDGIVLGSKVPGSPELGYSCLR
jgi:hypothetical protein